MIASKLRALQLALFGLSVSLIAAPSFGSSNSDQAKEKRWEEQIVPSLMVGEDVKLQAGAVEFLGLFTESATDETKGAVILLHGIGVHPAWPDVIEPLRMHLPEKGWSTLSLQMPILKNEAENKDYPPVFPEVPKRIQAGVDFLKSKGIKNIIVSGHSLGATMATYYMASSRDPDVKGFALLSAGPGYLKDERMNSVENFKKIKNVRILDVFGSDDSKFVIETSVKRKKIGPKVHGDRYSIIKINGANHFYHGKQDELDSTVLSWLNKYFAK